MRHFLILLFVLAGLAGRCIAAAEQPMADSDSTSPPAGPAPDSGDDHNKKPAGKDRQQPAGEEAEPDCE